MREAKFNNYETLHNKLVQEKERERYTNKLARAKEKKSTNFNDKNALKMRMIKFLLERMGLNKC